ncbi:MAG TPA: PAS domain S-box protein [Bryobacterales bacterium]|nr:PAS domain S-box protein [Bryobacterales bacterium]
MFLSAGAWLAFVGAVASLAWMRRGAAEPYRAALESVPVIYFALWTTCGYFVFIGLGLAALLKPYRVPLRSIRPAVVVDTLLLGFLTLDWEFSIAAAARLASARSISFGMAFFPLTLALLCAGSLTASRHRREPGPWKRTYRDLALAAACQSASRTILALSYGSLAPSTFATPAAADVLQTAAFFLLASAARHPTAAPAASPKEGSTAEPPIISVWRELSIPFLTLLGIGGIPLIEKFFGSRPGAFAPMVELRRETLLVSLGVYVVLVLARQFLVQMENRDLALDLQQESARLRLLLDNIHDAVITEDLRGRLVFANDRFLHMFGLRRDQIGGLRLDACIHPEDRRLRHDWHEPLFADSEGGARFEFRGLRSDGTTLYLESSVVPVCLRGMVLGYQSVIRDITERRKAEERQRELVQRLEFLVSHMPLGCIVFDLDFRILEWNSSASRIFGWSAPEVFGRNGLELLVAPESRLEIVAAWKELQLSQRSDHRVTQNLTKDRGVIECEWFNTSLIDETGAVVAVASMVQDVTERKNLEAQLRQSQKMEAIGVLAGGIAHDFKNLLTVIVGNISLALMRLGAAHPAGRGLQDAEKAAERAAELVQQLLGFSRKSPIRPRPIDLNASVRESVDLLRRTVDPRIIIETSEQPDLWLVEADRGQINQILLNLCLNARDAMEDGGCLSVSTANLVIGADYCRSRPEARPGEFVCLRVADTGAGMDQATLSRIFEPFFTTKQVGKGTGLGLSMVYGIVKQHGGWITVESQPRCGSVFSVFLPRSPKAAEEDAPRVTPSDTKGSETVLLVDDEEMIRTLATDILERRGYRVLQAQDGEEALEVVRQDLPGPPGRIDIVLLDMTMPRKSGRDTLAALREVAPELPVVLASGYSADGNEDLAALGARAFIQKPYRPEDLLRTLRAVLDSALRRQTAAEEHFPVQE